MEFWVKYCCLGLITMISLEILARRYTPEVKFSSFDRILGIVIFPIMFISFLISFLYHILKNLK